MRLVALRALTGLLRAKVGSRVFDLVITPFFGADGEPIAAFVEWRDRTVELQAQTELHALVAAAAKGAFSIAVAENGGTIVGCPNSRTNPDLP